MKSFLEASHNSGIVKYPTNHLFILRLVQWHEILCIHLDTEHIFHILLWWKKMVEEDTSRLYVRWEEIKPYMYELRYITFSVTCSWNIPNQIRRLLGNHINIAASCMWNCISISNMSDNQKMIESNWNLYYSL